MMIITDTAVRKRTSVVVMIFVIIIFGLVAYSSMPREASPDITIPYIFISTSYPGVAPEDIEKSITIPIEKKLKGLEAVKQIQSSSTEGMSSIIIEFVAGTDIDEVLSKTKDKVDLAKQELPSDLQDDPEVMEINKKKKSAMQKLKKEFINGCENNNIDIKTAKELFELIYKFADYGFNKSHSAAYALLAYQTAYLKKHYPAEFMAATLTSEINDSPRIVILIDECRRMGIEILPPNVNISGDVFEVIEKDKISFALSAIKNVGKSAICSIIKAREEFGKFKNIFHLLENVDMRAVNKKVLEALIQGGALDDLEGTRAQNFAAIELAINYSQKYQSLLHNKSQINIFEVLNNTDDDKEVTEYKNHPDIPEVPAWPIQELLEREKELLGFYISGHPLDRYSKEIKLFGTINWEDLESFVKNKEIRTAAIITQVRTHLDRKGNIMAFITMEDRSNSFEGVIFSSIYEKYGNFINKGEMVFIVGKVSEVGEQSFKVLCDEIIPISEVRNRFSNGLKLVIDTTNFIDEKIEKLLSIIEQNPGTIPLYFEMRPNGNGSGIILKSRKYQILMTDELLFKLQNLLGKEKVIVNS